MRHLRGKEKRSFSGISQSFQRWFQLAVKKFEKTLSFRRFSRERKRRRIADGSPIGEIKVM